MWWIAAKYLLWALSLQDDHFVKLLPLSFHKTIKWYFKIVPYNQIITKHWKRITKPLETWVFMFFMVVLLINSLEFPPAVKIIVPFSHLIFIQAQTLPTFSSSELCVAVHLPFLWMYFSAQFNWRRTEKKGCALCEKHKSLLDREGLENKRIRLLKCELCLNTT